MTMHKLVMSMIIFTFICIVAYYVVLGVIAVKLSSSIEKDGLKNVIEKVWCGEQGCEKR